MSDPESTRVLEKEAPAVIVIPARYQSTRFPGKPLAPVRGATGQKKPLIQRSLEAARQVQSAAAIYVATDDRRIGDAVEALGASALMTPESCANGTERIASALPFLPASADIIVNFQGDALLTPPAFVERLIAHMRANPDCRISTIAIRCSPGTYRHLCDDQAAGRVGGTTILVGAKGDALYFSKRVLPYIPPASAEEADSHVLLHLGIYAYRREALQSYVEAEAPAIERLEGLEQLRFLHHGLNIAVVICDSPGWDMLELNNPEDLTPIEAILAARGVE